MKLTRNIFGFISITFAFWVASCESKSSYEKIVEDEKKLLHYKSQVESLLVFLEITNNNASIAQNIETKLITSNDEIIPCSFDKGINTLITFNKNENSLSAIPIFRLKNSNKVVVFAKGRGQWGNILIKILINVETLIISKVEITQENELLRTKNISDSSFEDKFLNMKYAISNYDTCSNCICIPQPSVDGITGATESSDVVLSSICESIEKNRYYFEYFEKNN